MTQKRSVGVSEPTDLQGAHQLFRDGPRVSPTVDERLRDLVEPAARLHRLRGPVGQEGPHELAEVRRRTRGGTFCRVRPGPRAPAVALDGAAGIAAIAGDTDGVDGAVETAGAMVAPDTLARAHARGLDARGMLDDNDAHGFFEAIGDTVVTGPTLTNVNDFRAILVDPS